MILITRLPFHVSVFHVVSLLIICACVSPARVDSKRFQKLPGRHFTCEVTPFFDSYKNEEHFLDCALSCMQEPHHYQPEYRRLDPFQHRVAWSDRGVDHRRWSVYRISFQKVTLCRGGKHYGGHSFSHCGQLPCQHSLLCSFKKRRKVRSYCHFPGISL